ncbi:MAG: hypothetical protein L0H63_00005, partial [Nitrococcus sp.]|nr:hypothetical protein [Nitrococcus sp.]
LAPQLTGEALPYERLVHIIKTFKVRSELLTVLGAWAPYLKTLAGQESIGRLAAAIAQISAWFP